MQNKENQKKIWNIAEIAIILVLCLITLLFDIKEITQGISLSGSELRNKFLLKIIQQGCGAMAAILLMRRLNIKLFGKPQRILYLIPCLIIAIDNFQFHSYFKGNMELIHNQPLDFVLFALYCLSVGTFEECIFRGVIFSVLASRFSKDKKGLMKTFVVSSLVFGVSHLFNGFSFGTILQVGYTILTGGLFAFVLMKTKNIFCCAFVHGLYNFGGLLFETAERFGLGSGVVFDGGTAITMIIVCSLLGAFILYSVFKYSFDEQKELYEKLGVPINDKAE